MKKFTVVQISDTHLSRSHAYFQDNWEACVDYLNVRTPALVIHTGDVAFNAPEVPDDLAFSREQLDRLPCPWVAIPGNHDVGEPGESPRLGQHIGEPELAGWAQHFGLDHFCQDIEDWRFIGINSELLGSELQQEKDQWQFLANTLASADTRSIGLFLHKPLFHDNINATAINGVCVHPVPRGQMRQLVEHANVKFIACGHTHAYHHSMWNGLEIVWCPTTAFVQPDKRWPGEAVNRSGLIEWTFTSGQVSHQVVEPDRFANIDLTNWTRTSGTTITLPPLAQRPS